MWGGNKDAAQSVWGAWVCVGLSRLMAGSGPRNQFGSSFPHPIPTKPAAELSDCEGREGNSCSQSLHKCWVVSKQTSFPPSYPKIIQKMYSFSPMMKSNEEHVHAALQKRKNDKLNHVSFDDPLSVTDLHLCCLTGMIDTAEHSSIFKHTDWTKSHFILARGVYRRPSAVQGKHPLMHWCFSWQCAASHCLDNYIYFYDP